MKSKPLMKDRIIENPRDRDRCIGIGQTVKAGADGTVEGLLIAFTDQSRKDLWREYFDQNTDLMMESFPVNSLPVLYHHGLDDTVGVKAVGRVLKAEITDAGLWIQAQLEMRDEYERYIYELAQAGKLGWSSGALPQSVKVDESGHIKSWAIIEASMTPTPAMPLDTQITAKADLKLTSRTESESESESTKEAIMNMQQLMDVLNRYLAEALAELFPSLAESDDEASEEEVKMDEVLDEEEVVEEVKQAFEELPEEEQKSITLERVMELIADASETVFKARMDERRRAKAVLRQRAQDRQKNAPAKSDLPAYRKNEASMKRVEVQEDGRYINLSGSDMALGILLKMANIPEPLKARITLGDLADDSYVRHMANKISHEIDNLPRSEQYAVKSSMPFKADEVNATDISGQGQEWVSTYYASDLWERARPQAELFNLLTQKGMYVTDIPQGANQAQFPLDTSSPTVFTRPEANDLDATNRPETTANITAFGTGSVTATAKQHVVATFTTDELIEDSIVNTVQWRNRDMALTLAEALEDSIINGDTATAINTNINLIDGTPASGINTPLYIAYNGLRKNPLVTNTSYSRDAGATLTIHDYINTQALLDGKIRNRRDNLIYVIDYDTEIASRKLPELLTQDVSGGQATLFTGELPAINKIQVYTSEFLRLANSAGKVPNAGGTLGSILLVYAPYWGYARKRQITIKTADDILAGGQLYVATVRHAFTARSASASAISYNVGV